MEENTRLEIQRLTDQVVKAHKNIFDLLEKSNRFTVVNDKKYMQIWDMNAKSANQLLGKVRVYYARPLVDLVAVDTNNDLSDFKRGQSHIRAGVAFGVESTRADLTEEGRFALISRRNARDRGR